MIAQTTSFLDFHVLRQRFVFFVANVNEIKASRSLNEIGRVAVRLVVVVGETGRQNKVVFQRGGSQ